MKTTQAKIQALKVKIDVLHRLGAKASLVKAVFKLLELELEKQMEKTGVLVAFNISEMEYIMNEVPHEVVVDGVFFMTEENFSLFNSKREGKGFPLPEEVWEAIEEKYSGNDFDYPVVINPHIGITPIDDECSIAWKKEIFQKTRQYSIADWEFDEEKLKWAEKARKEKEASALALKEAEAKRQREISAEIAEKEAKNQALTENAKFQFLKALEMQCKDPSIYTKVDSDKLVLIIEAKKWRKTQFSLRFTYEQLSDIKDGKLWFTNSILNVYPEQREKTSQEKFEDAKIKWATQIQAIKTAYPSASIQWRYDEDLYVKNGKVLMLIQDFCRKYKIAQSIAKPVRR